MRIQAGPSSANKQVLVLACRESGGFWASKRFALSEDADLLRESFYPAMAWAKGLDKDEYYLSFNMENISEKKAEGLLFGAPGKP